jgi:hypothetical protein
MNIVITFDDEYELWKSKENYSSIELQSVLTIACMSNDQLIFS